MALLQWPEAIVSDPRGRELETKISDMNEKAWFTSPKAEQSAAETAIQQFLSSVGVEHLPVRWLDKQQLPSFIEGYQLNKDPLWSKLYHLPQKIHDAAAAKGIDQELTFTLNDVPEYLFHVIYDGAFRAFEQQGEQVVRHTVALALYLTSLSAAWDAACDERNPLAELLEVMRLGFLPLGVQDNAFYLY